MNWEDKTLANFNKMLTFMPIFARRMAERMVRAKSEINATERKSEQIEEQDMVHAFMTECPGPFKSQMIDGLKKLGIDVSIY